MISLSDDMDQIAEESENLVEIILNNEGEDFTVIVPIEVANSLLNDPDAAKKFIIRLLREGQDDEESNPNVDVTTQPTTLNVEEHVEAQPANKFVWTSKKPTSRDIEATKLFLNLRQEYCDKFDDKKTVKSQLWHMIAKKMNDEGYYVGEGREAIEKCRIKFANMQKQYLQHIKHMNTTGESKKIEPPFFEEMHDILGKKDKVNPQHTQDTLEIDEAEPSTSNYASNEKENQQSSKADLIKNRFKTERSVRPKSSNLILAELMTEQHAEVLKMREEELKHFSSLMEIQNEQRERFLNQFERLVNSQMGRKRRRSSSSSSST